MILFLWPHCSGSNDLVTSNMAPAHPHATLVAVYPALFYCNLIHSFWGTFIVADGALLTCFHVCFKFVFQCLENLFLFWIASEARPQTKINWKKTMFHHFMSSFSIENKYIWFVFRFLGNLAWKIHSKKKKRDIKTTMLRHVLSCHQMHFSHQVHEYHSLFLKKVVTKLI